MKYEKFEKWMIGKKFYHKWHNPDDIGVIIGEGEYEGVLDVIYEINGPSCTRLCNINFVDSPEEKPSETKPIEWEVGQVVWDVRNGRGIVNDIRDGEVYPIYVVFDLTDRYGDAISDTYTRDGRYVETQKNRSLFFSEPVITAELYPPKKPFAPTLKKGEVVIATTLAPEERSIVVFVNKETEECVEGYTTQGPTLYTYDKCKFKFYKVGEEIKFN